MSVAPRELESLAPKKPRVRLMLTCLCDAYFGEIGIATVKVLEHAGCEVLFDERQTCCGQPPFNAGDWDSARTVADRTVELFRTGEPIIVPSGSCTAMLREGYPMLFPKLGHLPAFELSEYLVRELGINSWPRRPLGNPKPMKIAFHRACHGRSIGLGDVQEFLLATVPGVELVRFDQEEQCCGFGGAFSATFTKVSAGIGREKLRNIVASGATVLASGDMGCLMHLGGLIEREGIPLKVMHFAEILAGALSE